MFQNAGITPDIFTFAKGVASGMPMGGCVARIEVAEAFEPGDHGSTFGGSNLAAAAAYATLDTLKTGNFGERVENRGDYFADKLLALDEVTEVRGSGLMIGAVLKDEFKAPFVVDAALDAGFITTLPTSTRCVSCRHSSSRKRISTSSSQRFRRFASIRSKKRSKLPKLRRRPKKKRLPAQEEYERLMKEAENVNANFKEVMEMLKDKVGNAEDKLGDALKKDAAQKKSSSDDAAEGSASEGTK